MFQLVVICAFFAAAAAKPSVVPIIPLSTSYVSPVTTTYHTSSVISPSPFVYSTPDFITHLIKKRSPQWLNLAPNYIATNPALATAYGAPWVHGYPLVESPWLSSAPATFSTAHLIKKRSTVLPTTYIAPTTYAAAATPIVSTYTAGTPLFSATPLISSPLISHPITYSTPFIK